MGVIYSTLSCPDTVMLPLVPTSAAKNLGFTIVGSMASPSTTPFGALLIMRSSSRAQVEPRKSLDAAILLIISSPSALKMRKSERVVMLGPNASGFCETFPTNSFALIKEVRVRDWHKFQLRRCAYTALSKLIGAGSKVTIWSSPS